MKTYYLRFIEVRKNKHKLSGLLKVFSTSLISKMIISPSKFWFANGERPLRMSGPMTQVFTSSDQKIFKKSCLAH